MGAKYREDIGGRAVVADRRRRRWRSLVYVPEPEAGKDCPGGRVHAVPVRNGDGGARMEGRCAGIVSACANFLQSSFCAVVGDLFRAVIRVHAADGGMRKRPSPLF